MGLNCFLLSGVGAFCAGQSAMVVTGQRLTKRNGGESKSSLCMGNNAETCRLHVAKRGSPCRGDDVMSGAQCYGVGWGNLDTFYYFIFY